MELPPLEAGALQDAVAWPLPLVALTLVGAPGTVRGVTADEALEKEEVPATLVARTVKV